MSVWLTLLLCVVLFGIASANLAFARARPQAQQPPIPTEYPEQVATEAPIQAPQAVHPKPTPPVRPAQTYTNELTDDNTGRLLQSDLLRMYLAAEENLRKQSNYSAEIDSLDKLLQNNIVDLGQSNYLPQIKFSDFSEFTGTKRILSLPIQQPAREPKNG
jgi:hypothetical protein